MNKTNKKAPHIAIGKECYINHDELFNYFKNAVKHAEKELDKELERFKKNPSKEESNWIIQYANMLNDQLWGQLLMIRNLNCISEGKYKWWNDYIWKEIICKYTNAVIIY